MIEVNLLPEGRGKRKGRSRKRPSLSLPSIQGMPGDGWVVGSGALAVLALILIGWMYFAVAGEAEELESQIQVAERDSIRMGDVIERSERLRARGDSIARRVDIIQQIDGNRYVWPHIMDEVARALPDFTWLTRIQQISPGDPVAFRIEGRAGTYFALTSFMEGVEASPFIRGTRLINSDQISVGVGGGAERLVYGFVLEAEYRSPPSGLVETEPLFGPSVQPAAASEGG